MTEILCGLMRDMQVEYFLVEKCKLQVKNEKNNCDMIVVKHKNIDIVLCFIIISHNEKRRICL